MQKKFKEIGHFSRVHGYKGKIVISFNSEDPSILKKNSTIWIEEFGIPWLKAVEAGKLVLLWMLKDKGPLTALRPTELTFRLIFDVKVLFRLKLPITPTFPIVCRRLLRFLCPTVDFCFLRWYASAKLELLCLRLFCRSKISDSPPEGSPHGKRSIWPQKGGGAVIPKIHNFPSKTRVFGVTPFCTVLSTDWNLHRSMQSGQHLTLFMHPSQQPVDASKG